MKRTSSRNSEAEVYDALKTSSSAFGGVAIFSAIINLLMLTGSIYMLQIYDRVLSSRSIPTLIGISFIILCRLHPAGRSRQRSGPKMLARIGARFDENCSRPHLRPRRHDAAEGREAVRQHAADPRSRPDPGLPVRPRARRLCSTCRSCRSS